MNAIAERRQYTRVAVDVAARIHVPEGPIISGHVADLSLGGVRVTSDEIAPDGARCAIELDIPSDNDAETLAVSGAIVRGWEEGAAIEFRDIDEDAWERLLDVLTTNEFDRARLRKEAAQAG
jgi:c-di-GMP-binding flagellar brake protein YcgR